MHQVGLKTTIPGDVFNILLCTSDIFFCMKSDICPVNILQLLLCTEKKKRKKNYTLTKKMMPGRRLTTGLQLPQRGAEADEEPE